MAVDITGTTILEPVIVKMENPDKQVGLNWGFEIVQLAVGTNTSTTYTFSTAVTAWPAATSATGMLKIKYPKYLTIDGMDDTSTGFKTAYNIYSDYSTVVITWAVAPTGTAKYRVKIEGYY